MTTLYHLQQYWWDCGDNSSTDYKYVTVCSMILLREIIASFHGPRLIQLIYIKRAVRKDYIKCRFAPFTHLRIANVLAHAPNYLSTTSESLLPLFGLCT